MDQNAIFRIAQDIHTGIDWEQDSIADISSSVGDADPTKSVLAYIAYLRARETPRLSHPREYVEAIRDLATEEQRHEAVAKIEESLTRPTEGRHTNPITAAGDDSFFLAVDEAMSARIADRVLENEEEWDKGSWGTTRSICELISRALLTPDYPDQRVVPLLGWLLKQFEGEWKWARTWDGNALGDSGHNWWLHTYMGFYLAGLWFPEVKGFKQFRAFAPEYFEYEMKVLMEVDGFTRERSGYHWGTVRHWSHVYERGLVDNTPWSDDFMTSLREVGNTLWKILAPNGDEPHVGDTRAAYKADDSLSHVRMAAALLGLPKAKYVCEQLAPNWKPKYPGFFPFNGRNLLPAYESLEAEAPTLDPADTTLPESGYYFIRQNWTRESDWMSIEAGPLGNRVTSHDHTHVFNVELYSRGRAILVDNCSGPYGDEPSRTWRVGSSSHNVATVDGEDHIRVKNEWRWIDRVIPMVNEWVSNKQYAYFSGAHEGYDQLPESVPSSRRKLFYLRGKYWIMIDRFGPATDAAHLYEQHFHLNVPYTLGEDGRLVTSGDGGNLLLVQAGTTSPQHSSDKCPYPLEKYDNPDHITYSIKRPGNVLFVTVMVPFADDDVPDVSVSALDVRADGRILDPWEATGLEIIINGQRDVYIDQHMQWNLPWEAGERSGSSRVFHSACD